jgi:hypothetical protein
MKRKLLSLICIMFVSFGFAQTQTITIPWDYFSVPAGDPFFNDGPMFDTNITIEVGDTVVWEWEPNAMHHNIKSVAGSTETFGTPGDENATFNAPYSYSYTFTQVGTNDFVCQPHQTFMYGSVTVVPEGTLSTGTFDKVDFKIAPNPAKKKLNITLPNAQQNASVEVFDVLGKRVYAGEINTLKKTIDVSEWNKGLYLVRITSDNGSQTKRLIKQ